MVQALDDLAEDGGDEAACEGFRFAALDELIKVSLHRLEDKIQLLCGWKEKEIVQWNNIRMRGYCAQGL